MKKIFLVDGANVIYRAYYAIPRLSNSKGQPTGALLGYARILLKLIREQRPDMMAVCLDTPEPTFRDGLFKDYKANRKEPPDELVQQFPYVEPITRALGIAIIERPGFEADDLIGTVAKKFSDMGHEVVIVSGDKDMMQLVGPGVSMLDEMKGLRIGPKEVLERFGVPPNKVVEVLGLSGDQSDNVPGIPGIGPKTASALIQKYGSVENVIVHASELKGALAEKVRSHTEDARLSRRLVEIKVDVDLDIEADALLLRGTDDAKVRNVFGELEFSKLLSELSSPVTAADSYNLIEDEAGLQRLAAAIGKTGVLGIWVAADGENPMRAELIGLALSWDAKGAAFVPFTCKAKAERGETGDLFSAAKSERQGLPADVIKNILCPVFTDVSIKKIGHDLNFIQVAFTRLGLTLAAPKDDVMLISYVENPAAGHDIESMAQRYLGVTLHREKETAEALCQYACSMADATRALFEKLSLDRSLMSLYRDIELPLVDVLVSMELTGIKIDKVLLCTVDAEFSARLTDLEGKIFKEAGEEFNINSPKQLGNMLFEKLKLPGVKRTKTGFSTSQDILEELATRHELPSLVLEYRSLSKLKSTYVGALPNLADPATHRVHTFFNQAVTATGRLSSSDPNLQNIPVRGDEGRRIREAFIADDGFMLMSADYSQIELRVLAHMSQDKTLLDAFSHGLDVHAITAAGIFGVSPEAVTKEQRAVGKTVNFATIYGQGAFGLSRQLGIKVDDAVLYIENYFKKYPQVFKYRDDVIARVKKEGKVATLFGRVRFIPDITSSNAQLAEIAKRTAFNTIFQGTAADIIKKAMIEINAGLGEISARSRMLLQVHDELLFEVSEKEIEAVKKFVSDKMQNAAALSVPLTVDINVSRTW